MLQEMNSYAGIIHGNTWAREPVRAWDVGVLGLVLAEMVNDDDGRPCWAITHTGSGYAVSDAYSRTDDAIDAAHRLARLTDWTAPRSDLEAGIPGLRQAVDEATDTADVPRWRRP